MAIYKETERVLTSSCDISIDYAIRVWLPNIAGEGGAYVNGRVGEGGGHMAWFGAWEFSTNTAFASSTTWSYQVRMTLTAGNGHGVTTVPPVTIVIASGTRPRSQFYFDVIGNISGTWVGTGTGMVLWDITEEADPPTIEMIKWPRKTSVDYYEYSKPTATMTSTITFGGQSATATGVVGLQRIRANYTFKLKFEGFAADGFSSTATLSNVKINGNNVGYTNHTHTFNGQSASNWSTTVSAIAGATSSTVLESSARLPATCTVNAVARAWDAAFPLPLTWRIYGFDNLSLGYRDVADTGSISAADTYEDYKFKSTLNALGGTSIHTTELHDIPEKIYAKLTTTSLVLANEDLNNDRVLMRGFRFPAWDLTHALTYEIPGTGNDRTYDPMQGMSGYRYMDIQVKCRTGSNQEGTIEITDFHGNAKVWTVTAPTTAHTTIRIDLCSPDDGPETDAKDDPYPRKNVANNAYEGDESVDSAYWGVTAAGGLRVASGEIDIGTTTLVRQFTDSTYVPSGKEHRVERITQSVVSESGSKTTFWCRRFWQQDVDGRNEEESDVWWQKFEGGGTGVIYYTVTPQTISSLLGQITTSDDGVKRHPGWSATLTTPYPGSVACSVAYPQIACYLNSETGYATWLYGGGILATAGTTGTQFSYGHAIGGEMTTTSVVAQMLFDEINGTFPPDRPDPFDVSGGADVGLTLPGGTILGGNAHGGVLKTNGKPNKDADVYLKLDSNDSDRGFDEDLDLHGRYYTGPPKGLGEQAHKIETGTLVIGILIHSSKRQRGWFKEGGNPTSAYIAFYRHGHDRACLYHVVSDTGLVVWDYLGQPNDPASVKTETIVDSDDTAKMPAAWLRPEEVNEVVYLRGSSPVLARSNQFVRSWKMTVIPGTAEALTACHQNNRLVVALYHTNRWYVRVGKLNPSTGAYTFSAESPILATGAARPYGHLFTRADNVIEFAYINNADQPRIVRCHSLSVDGTGTWA